MLNSISTELEKELRDILPVAAFPSINAKYLTEPRGRLQGKAGLLIAPKNTEQVSYVVGRANAEGIGIIPYGGGTGLVGGQVLDSKPEVLTQMRMSLPLVPA